MKVIKYSSIIATTLSSFLVLAIASTLIVYSLPAITTVGTNFFSTQWFPYNNQYGIFPMVIGTLYVSLIALFFALPLGIGTAIYINQFCSKNIRLMCKMIAELLASIPSIIFGLIGIALLASFIQEFFDIITGRTIFTAGILLACMILPLIISISEDAFEAIDNNVLENGYALGMNKIEVIFRILIPESMKGLKSALLLSFGRALGETMAVMLVVGSIDKIPQPFYNVLIPAQTFTSRLGREIAEVEFGSLHFSGLTTLGLILFFFIFFIVIIGKK